MAFEADLSTVLKTVCARSYLGFAKVGTERPYVTAQQIPGEAITQLSNAAPGLRKPEIQIDVWADSYNSAITTMRAIEAAMRAATTFTATPMDEPGTYFDADVPVYGARQSFRCWHRS
jgi:hypothetical protein